MTVDQDHEFASERRQSVAKATHIHVACSDRGLCENGISRKRVPDGAFAHPMPAIRGIQRSACMPMCAAMLGHWIRQRGGFFEGRALCEM